MTTCPAGTADPKGIATRAASGKVINAITPKMPELWGGSADLAESNNTTPEGEPSFLPTDRQSKMFPGGPYGRVLHFGIREHAMGAILNGIKVHGGTRPYGATFLTFSDYMRPSVRLSALMRVPVLYIWTHDSIGLGEDGPTHQPIEHVAALRLIPGLDVVRPADANETAACWAEVLRRTDRPAGLILTRQALPIVPRGEDGFADTSGVAKGAYVLRDSDGDPDVILIGTGSEVQYAVEAQRLLADEGISARVVSMPCREWFDEQDQDYRDSVIPPAVKARVSVEAGVAGGWRDIVGDAGRIISIDHYGASASGAKLFEEFGFSAAMVVEAAKESLGAADAGGRPDPSGGRRAQRHRRTWKPTRGSPSAEPSCPFLTKEEHHERTTQGAGRCRRLHLAGRPLARPHHLGQPGRAGVQLSRQRRHHEPDDLRGRPVQGSRATRTRFGSWRRGTPVCTTPSRC